VSTTPGPWTVSKHGTPAYHPQFGVYAPNANDHIIVSGQNAQADANLVAAAPDLLTALREIESLLDCGNIDESHWQDCLGIARAAIAKAEQV